MYPQFKLSCWHVSGVHAVTHAPFEHDWLPEHVPQLCVSPPQPSATWPQTAPSCVHDFGVHGTVPHWPGTPPAPQPWPAGQSPQLAMRPPQPSAVGPHCTPSCEHVLGVHVRPTHTLNGLQYWFDAHGGHV
jgi:hypothetical protein